MIAKKADLRSDFHDWLVQQGLSEKTRTGRRGSIYEYLRCLDRVCDIVQSKHDDDSWRWLAKNIYPILGFFILCKNGPVKINESNVGHLKEFWSAFFDCLPSFNEEIKNHLVIQTQIDGKMIREYKIIRTFVLNNLTKDTNDLILFLNIPKVVANGERKALQKFYLFLKDVLYTSPECKTEDLTRQDFHYRLISYYFEKISYFGKPNFAIYYVIVESGYYKAPPQFRATEEHDEYLSKDEVSSFFRISSWYLEELNNTGLEHPLIPEPDGTYSLAKINKFIKHNFHASDAKQEVPNAKDIHYWWTPEEISKKFGISQRYIRYLRDNVAYIRIGKRKFLYYPYEFKRFSKKKVRIHEKIRKKYVVRRKHKTKIKHKK